MFKTWYCIINHNLSNEHHYLFSKRLFFFQLKKSTDPNIKTYCYQNVYKASYKLSTPLGQTAFYLACVRVSSRRRNWTSCPNWTRRSLTVMTCWSRWHSDSYLTCHLTSFSASEWSSVVSFPKSSIAWVSSQRRTTKVLFTTRWPAWQSEPCCGIF